MKRSSIITWEQVRVVLVVGVALTVLTLTIIRLGKATNLFAKRYDLIAFLSDGNGLTAGSQVTIAGQLAGTIKRIDFLPIGGDTTRNLRLVLSLDRNLREQVRRDSRAQIRTMGLLGDRYIDITPGTPKGAVLVDGDTIPVEPAINYEAVLARASGAVTDVVGLTHDLQTITGGIVRGQGTLGQLLTNRSIYDQMAGTLARTNALLERVQNSKGTLAKFLDDSTLYTQMVAAVTSTDSLIAALNNKQGTLGKLLNDDSLYKNLVGVTYTMVGVANNADSLMKMIAAGKGTAGRLITDQSLYDSLNKLVNDLSALLGDIRSDPRKYFKGLIKVF